VTILDIRDAVADAITALLPDLATAVDDTDIEDATIRGCISPVVEVEASDTGYFVDIYPLTRAPSRATRSESEKFRLYRVVARRVVTGDTAEDRNGLIDKFVLFADLLASECALFNGEDWGVVRIEDGDCIVREALESEHLCMCVIDLGIISNA
jgi:hypothetical protein